MNNLDVERIGLIDISLEDDFLIDKHLHNMPVDLRLSVALETQNELAFGFNSSARLERNDRVPLFAEKERQGYRVGREDGSNVRKSMAWDNAFFTSPGFLELEELSLVNRGYKNPEGHSVYGKQENVRSKICQEIDSSSKAGFGAVRRQNTQSFMKPKLVSPSKMMAMQDSQRPVMMSRRSEAISGMPPKAQAVQNTTSRIEYLKSGRGQIKVSTAHTKKPPLQVVSRNGKNEGLVSQHPDSLSVSSISSTRYLLSSIASSASMDLSPYKSCDYDVQTTNLLRSQEPEGECLLGSCAHTVGEIGESRNIGPIEVNLQSSKCFNSKIDFSQACNLEAHENNQQQFHTRIKQQTKGRDLLRQSALRATRRSPLSAESHLRRKPSSLRLPSEKIGFFDTSEEQTQRNCSPLYTKAKSTTPEDRFRSKNMKTKGPEVSLNRKVGSGSKDRVFKELEKVSRNGMKPSDKEHQKGNQLCFKKQTDLGNAEKENIFQPEDTVIELEIKKKTSSGSQLSTVGSSRSSQCSSSFGQRMLEKSTQQSFLSPVVNRTRFPSKVSPLKRSAFF